MGIELLEKIQSLPYDKQKEVVDFVDSLIFKTSVEKNDDFQIKPGFGGGKGFILYMADDFDEPLEDFKDYM